MNTSIYSRQFWLDTFERVLRTTVQAALVIFGLPGVATATDADFGGLTFVNWQGQLVTIALIAVATLMTCIAGRGVGDPSTASLTSGTADAPTYPYAKVK